MCKCTSKITGIGISQLKESAFVGPSTFQIEFLMPIQKLPFLLYFIGTKAAFCDGRSFSVRA